MASVASRVSKASRLARDDPRIIHEGWTEHFSVNYKTWYRYWMILTDTDVELYSVITPSGKRQLSGKVHISSTTEIVNSSGPMFGFELVTLSSIGQQKELFKFKNENDRDLWKAYIIGLTSGSVPADVNLLPGQLRDVRHAVHQVPAPALPPPTVRHRPLHVQDSSQRHVTPRRSSPELPPVPTSPPPPPPATTTTTLTSVDGVVDESRLPPVDYDADEDDEVRAYAIGDGRVSVRMCNGIAKVYESTADDDEIPVNEAPTNGLQQLMVRQSNLAFKTLDDERQLKRGHTTSRFVGQWLPSSSSHLQRARSLSSGASGLQLGSASVRFFANERSWSDRLQPATTRGAINNGSNNNNKKRNSTNNEAHPFYADTLKNSFPPSWFVECDRETAESVLLASRNHGNVLMRPSNLTGSYGITMRCDEPSGSRILHYAVHRTSSGFRIAVENPQQRPMPCLGDVMDFFVQVVGPSAVPLTAVVGRNLLVTSPLQSPSSSSHPSVEQTINDVAATEVAAAMVTSDGGEGRNACSSTFMNGAQSWPTSFRTSPAVGGGLSPSTGNPGRQRVILNATVSGSRSPFAEPEPPPF